MRFNRPELSLNPDDPVAIRQDPERGLDLKQLEQKLTRTVVPTLVYAGLLFGGAHVEALAQKNKGRTQQRRHSVTKKKPATDAEIQKIVDLVHGSTAKPEKQKSKEQLAASLGLTSREELKDFNYLVEKIGIAVLHGLDNRKPIEPNASGKPEFTGLEKVQLRPEVNLELTPERLQEMLESTLPPAWFENIKKFEYKDELIPMDKTYGAELAGTKENPAYEAAHAIPEKLEVVITKAMENHSLRQYRRTWAHEAAHNNFALSAFTNPSRVPSKRDCFDLMLKIVQRLESPTRYRSDYVEKIDSGNAAQTMLNRMIEYWAVISEARIDGEVLPVEDENIVDWWVGYRDYKEALHNFSEQEKAWSRKPAVEVPYERPHELKNGAERKDPFKPYILEVRRRTGKN